MGFLQMEAAGIEPASRSPEQPASQDIISTGREPLAQTLARNLQNDPDLAVVVDAWPTLSEAVRMAILALAGTVRS
jgi:hypothetical protein